MLSVIIPANNEEALLGTCLESLLASEPPACCVEIVVVANGCNDNTAGIAREFQTRVEARGWKMQVLDLTKGGKIRALNAGDAVASLPWRAYLDADVTVSPTLLDQLCRALDGPKARYASGNLRITAEGWVQFPDIISDDTFVRLLFRQEERIAVKARYNWPLVEGFGNLVRVRRRQDRGVRQVAALYPELCKNDEKSVLGISGKLALLARNPVGFTMYSSVALAVRLGDTNSGLAGVNANLPDWSRGR